jgi:lipopolysaccharide export system protein LptA
MNGQLQRVVGIGHVVLRQPQRTGTGDRIVYTAADRIFVLTGSKGAPPKVIDDLHGTVSGATLRFRSGDETVFVDGDPALAERGRVTTDTKIKQ